MAFDAKATPAQRIDAVNRLIRDLASDDAPIIVGPWRSEVGFEGLYWMPFLAHIAKAVPKFKERAIVVTRGGMGDLYRHLASGSVDLYALRSVTELRRHNLADHQRTKLQKQLEPTSWDKELVQQAAAAAGIGAIYHTVHPAWMYWSLSPYWDEHCGLNHLAALTDYAMIPKPKLAEGSPLPPNYVAMKFYNRATFPYLDARHHRDLAMFIKDVVGTVAAQIPVVLLASSPEYDDHVDVPIKGKNISSLSECAPEVNLFTQATVLAHATAFIGVYGGVAQLALRMGVPSASFYHGWGATAHAHLSLSSALSKKTKVEFLVGDLDDMQLWKQLIVVPSAVVTPNQEATVAG